MRPYEVSRRTNLDHIPDPAASHLLFQFGGADDGGGNADDDDDYAIT